MQKAEARRIDICSVGPVPEVNHNSEDNPGIDATDLENEPISIEEGDQILATRLLPLHPWISACHPPFLNGWQKPSRLMQNLQPQSQSI